MTADHATRELGHGPGSCPASRSPRPRWRRLIAAGLIAALAVVSGGRAVLAQSSGITVENWASIPLGTTGIPPGWQGHKWGSPKYDFQVVEDGGGRVFLMKSDNESSSISKEIKVDVKQYPILEWKWKVVALPPGGSARKAETDDEAAQIYVTFPRFPTAVRSRIIGYIWDSTEPAGASFQSAKVSTVHFIVVRSGKAELGRWMTERRNVLEDFKKIYGETPDEAAGAVTLSINSQNTSSRAESYFGPISFKKP